jgi:two-component system, NtrC family, response regulator AtoC
VLERAVLTGSNDAVLEAADLYLQAGDAKKPSDLFIPETLEALEKKYIFTVLGKYEQNRTRAAEVLGISVRTLRNKLREYRGEAAEGGEDQE